MDPTTPPLCDGVSFTLCEDAAFACGGPTPEIIWRLNFISKCWSEIPSTGDTPAARLHHSCVYFAKHLLLCGGEPLLLLLLSSSSSSKELLLKKELSLLSTRELSREIIETPAAVVSKNISYYELSLVSFTWRRVETFGAIPLNRSHHSCNIVGESMILLGGKPIFNNNNNNNMITNAKMMECDKAGFYDIYILDIVSRVWRSIAPLGPIPHLWGHSAEIYDEKYLIIFGGLDVATEEQKARDLILLNTKSKKETEKNITTVISKYGSPHYKHDPPIATVSNKVYILDTSTMCWSIISAVNDTTDIPPPRALHNAFINETKMFIFDGFNVNRTGEVHLLTDLWIYNIPEGRWGRIYFPENLPIAVRRLSCMYAAQIVIAASMNILNYLDIHESRIIGEWKEVPTSQLTIEIVPALNNESDEFNSLINPRHSNDYFDNLNSSNNTNNGEKEENEKEFLERINNNNNNNNNTEEEYNEISQTPSPLKAPNTVPMREVDMIIKEIHQLRELVLAQRHSKSEIREEISQSPVITSTVHSPSVNNNNNNNNNVEIDINPKCYEGERENINSEENKRKKKTKSKDVNEKKERMRKLAARLAELEAIEELKIKQQQQQEEEEIDKNKNTEDEYITENQSNENNHDTINSFIKQNIQTNTLSRILSPDRDTPRRSQSKELNKETGNSPSIYHDESKEKWSKLIEIIKRSPSQPTERAFRASIVTL